MKKIMSIALAAAFAATVWADRTANREWVQRNFAPTNLVPRVEALEAGGGGEETDPVFGAWKGGTSIHIGQNASADGDGCILIGSGTWSAEPNAIAIGNGADCEVEEAIAIGKGAVANGWGTIQLGPGRNNDDATLQFYSWTVIDSEGNVPEGRLRYAVPSKPHKWWDDYGCVSRCGIVCFEPDALYEANPLCGMDECSIWNAFFRAGEEGVYVTFDGTETQIVDTDGKINPDCLPELHVTEADPVFASWKDNSVNVAIGKEAAVGEENSVSIGPNTSTYDGCTAVGAGAIALYPKSVAMGYQAGAFRNRAIALGTYAECNGSEAVQIGCGTNDTANTLQFMNWPLVGSDGKIPADRLSAANVLASIKTMNATQLAELKTFLGIE